MNDRLRGRVVAIVATDGVEESEYVQPRRAVEEAGGTAELLAPHPGTIQAMRGMDQGEKLAVDRLVADADPAAYHALLLPGGVANPDQLRTNPDVVRLVQAFVTAGKPIGAICHGPWTLIEAGAVRGRTLTSWPSLRTDLVNAGATWVDSECHNDRGLVTSRNPADLPAFCAKVVEEFEKFTAGRHSVPNRPR